MKCLNNTVSSFGLMPALACKPLTDGFLQRLFQFPLAAGHKHCYNTNMVAFAVNSTLEHLHLTRESMRGVLGFEANILLFKIDNNTQFLIDQWVDCALHKKCMYGVNRPKQDCRPERGTFIACHRFDQSTLNLLNTLERSVLMKLLSRSVSKRLILFDMQLMWREIT